MTAILFSPLDAGASIWVTAEPSLIELQPGSTTLIKTVQDRVGRDYPLSGFVYSGPAGERSCPRLSYSGSDRLAGRPTIRCLENGYIRGCTKGWAPLYANSSLAGDEWSATADPRPSNSAWFETVAGVSWPDPGLSVSASRSRSIWGTLPAEGYHAFVLCRFWPPTQASRSLESGFWDNRWIESSVDRARLRPGVWTTGGGLFGGFPPFGNPPRRLCPAIEIESWSASDPYAPGALRFTSSMDQAFWRYEVEGSVDYISIPWQDWGAWTLLEMVVDFSSVSLYRDGNLLAVSPVMPPGVEFSDQRADTPTFFANCFTSDDAIVDPSTSCGGGNLAELLYFPSVLSADNAHKVRAWILRKWGLGRLLPAVNPYRNGTIPGPSPQSVNGLPGVRPSARTYTPGFYSNTPFGSIGGTETRVRHSTSVHGGDALGLEFIGCSETELAALLDHYERRQGAYKGFALHPAQLDGLAPVASHLNRPLTRVDYAPSGSAWFYSSEPAVINQQLGVNNVSIQLELQPEPLGIEIAAEDQGMAIVSNAELIVS